MLGAPYTYEELLERICQGRMDRIGNRCAEEGSEAGELSGRREKDEPVESERDVIIPSDLLLDRMRYDTFPYREVNIAILEPTLTYPNLDLLQVNQHRITPSYNHHDDKNY